MATPGQVPSIDDIKNKVGSLEKDKNDINDEVINQINNASTVEDLDRIYNEYNTNINNLTQRGNELTAQIETLIKTLSNDKGNINNINTLKAKKDYVIYILNNLKDENVVNAYNTKKEDIQRKLPPLAPTNLLALKPQAEASNQPPAPAPASGATTVAAPPAATKPAKSRPKSRPNQQPPGESSGSVSGAAAPASGATTVAAPPPPVAPASAAAEYTNEEQNIENTLIELKKKLTSIQEELDSFVNNDVTDEHVKQFNDIVGRVNSIKLFDTLYTAEKNINTLSDESVKNVLTTLLNDTRSIFENNIYPTLTTYKKKFKETNEALKAEIAAARAAREEDANNPQGSVTDSQQNRTPSLVSALKAAAEPTGTKAYSPSPAPRILTSSQSSSAQVPNNPPQNIPDGIQNRVDDIEAQANKALGNLDLEIKDEEGNVYSLKPKLELTSVKIPVLEQLQGGTRKSVSGSHSRKVSNPKRATTRRKNNNKIKISNNKIKTRNNKIKISSSNRRRISKRHKSVRH